MKNKGIVIRAIMIGLILVILALVVLMGVSGEARKGSGEQQSESSQVLEQSDLPQTSDAPDDDEVGGEQSMKLQDLQEKESQDSSSTISNWGEIDWS